MWRIMVDGIPAPSTPSRLVKKQIFDCGKKAWKTAWIIQARSMVDGMPALFPLKFSVKLKLRERNYSFWICVRKGYKICMASRLGRWGLSGESSLLSKCSCNRKSCGNTPWGWRRYTLYIGMLLNDTGMDNTTLRNLKQRNGRQQDEKKIRIEQCRVLADD